AGSPIRLVETTIEVNEARKRAMADKIGRAAGDLNGRTVAILGLTFKPNTDDMRDAPSLEVAPRLIAMGATVQAFDPEGMEEARPLLAGVQFRAGPYEAVEGADVLVIMTEWDQFRALDLDRVKALMRRPVVVDLRNIYRPEEMRARGFQYASVGRG
ncbi:MAG TPA: UDP binding domain-containing protein, partial [Caulobacteraceae bacterium]